MIYEYPEEFIVPIVYAEDLKDNIYRCKKSESLNEGKLLIPDEELEGDGIFLAKVDIDIYGASKNKDIKFSNVDGEVFEEIHDEYIFKDNAEYENIKNIVSDIDEDYANSET